MKKLIVMLFALVAVLCMTVTVGAEEAAPAETVAEAAAETVAETVAVVVTETAEQTLPEEVAELLATATPEQIETVKQYILAGLDEMDKLEITGWDLVRAFVTEHLNEIAWMVAGVAFAVFYFGNKKNRRKLTECVRIVGDHASDMVEEMRQRSLRICAESEKNVADMMELAHRDAEAMLDEARACTEGAKTCTKEATERMESILEECRALCKASGQEIANLKKRETAAAEALKMMAEEVNTLLQLANLPEWKRDELQADFDQIKRKVEEVMHCEDNEEDTVS